MLKSDLWWFSNRQTPEQILQPAFFTPRSHFGIYLEHPQLQPPYTICFEAFAESGQLIHRAEFQLSESCENESCHAILRPGLLHIEGYVDTPESDPTMLALSCRTDTETYQVGQACQYHTLSGTIRDFSGQPFPAAFKLYRGGFNGPIGCWSDAEGAFSVDVPAGLYNAFYVDDNSYGKSSLELWGWHMIVDRDESYSFKIGNGEVYSLSTWISNGGLPSQFIYFRPMILTAAKEYELRLNDRDFAVLDIAPQLQLQDLRVRLNDRNAELISLQPILETGFSQERYAAMPAYILQIAKLPLQPGKQTLIVEYDTSARQALDPSVLLARSQGMLQYHYHHFGTCVQ